MQTLMKGMNRPDLAPAPFSRHSAGRRPRCPGTTLLCRHCFHNGFIRYVVSSDRGDFVCRKLGHVTHGADIERDKFKVASVFRVMLDFKIDHCLSVRGLQLARHFVSLFRWLVGRHASHNSHSSLSEFVAQLHWETGEEQVHSNI